MDRSPWGLTESDTAGHAHTQARTHRHTLRRHEEPPSLMPNLVVTISSFQEKHNLGKWRSFFHQNLGYSLWGTPKSVMVM